MAAAAKLCDRVYNLSGRVPPDQRVWVARTSSLYRYAQVLRQVAGNVEVDGIAGDGPPLVRRGVEPPAAGAHAAPRPARTHRLRRRPPTCPARGWTARSSTSFMRNAPDALGPQSITFVDDSQPRVLFDEVDFCYRHTNMSKRPDRLGQGCCTP